MKVTSDLRFVVRALPADGVQPNELARTMAPHPLIHQELPYDPEYAIYNRRLASISLNNYTANEVYWQVRTNVIMRHTGELPTEIRGPDAESFLNLIFTRDISKNRVGRCTYQIPCYHDGGMITDGVLVRLAEDRFWYGQADGDLFSWLKAHAAGFDVEIIDPEVWISQVQGPNSLRVLEAAADEPLGDGFKYFDAREVSIAGQRIWITRTGFTNELGWEFYLPPGIDCQAVGDRILAAGSQFDMKPASAEAFRTRRIEAGIYNAGSDFDYTTTPFAAGLGAMVDFEKGDFIGRDALMTANQRRRTWGMRVTDGVAQLGASIAGASDCKVCSSAWSPFQKCGVALVRMKNPDNGPGTKVEVKCIDGQIRPAELCHTPMYDAERLIPRGKLTNIPDRSH